MATHNQVLRGIRKPKKSKNPVHLLKGCPQRQVVCVRVFEMTPRKPNSAKRKVARVRFKNSVKNKRMLTAYIPGLGHKLQEHAAVMVCGGGAKDLPGINYRLIRGKYDFGLERYPRANRRSKYGAKKE